ncbi:MAG: hypothetical protein NC428_01100 [Clostridium sp.]|nr:hypothetical protein [Clostridium sp.]
MNSTNTVNQINPNNDMAALNTETDTAMASLSDTPADIAISQLPDTFTGNNFVINVFHAVIDDIFTDRGTRFVTISYDECVRCVNNVNRVTLIVDNNTLIIDQRGNTVSADRLRRGMNINASFSTAMTRSIPPQAAAYTIQLLNSSSFYNTTEGRIVNVNRANRFITVLVESNMSPIIRFNIAPDVIIMTPFGRSAGISSLMPGMRVRITHATFMTLSIPPQTTAYRIQIMR